MYFEYENHILKSLIKLCCPIPRHKILTNLNSVRKIHANNTPIASSIALVVMSMILCSSIFAQLYLLPFNPLNGTGQEDNKAYAAKQLKTRVSVDQDPIQQGDTQKITVIVRDANTNNKINNALVRLAIDPPSGKVATGSSYTDDNGQTTFNVRISSSADTGTFDVAARVSGNGYAAKTVSTSFEVISNNDNNNNNHNSGHNNNDRNNHNHNGGNNNNNNDQVQVISQSNVCGNGKGASDVNCQNLANQIQGDGNAVNVIGVQSGGGDGHGHGSNDGQTGQIGVQQSGAGGGGGAGNDNNGQGHHGQSQAIAQANVCGNGNGASDVNCQNIANQVQGGGNNKDGSNDGQSQAIAQANVCGNGKGASDVNCQNLANQIQGDGNAVNVIGVQSGGGDGHGHGSNSGSNDGQTGQIGVQQSGAGGGGGAGNDNNGHGHHGQSQAIAQANVCGNGKGASDVNCQNLANQIQGDGNAVNVIGVQSGDSKSNNDRFSGNGQSGNGFVKSSPDDNNVNALSSGPGEDNNKYSGACDQAINRHMAVGGLHAEMARQLRSQLCG